MLCKPNADFSRLREFTRSLLPLSSPASSGLSLTVAFFRKPEIGTGSHYPVGLSVPLSLKTAKLASLNLLLARGDFESPVCFHENLDNLVQSSGKLTNQKRVHDSRPNVPCKWNAARLALVKPRRIPHQSCFPPDSMAM